eukprot:gene3036-3578_t
MTDASFKAQGDKYLKNAQWQKAVDAYTSALARPEVAGCQVLDAVVLGSRSRCYAFLGNLENAVVDARFSVLLDPSYAQGYYRLGCALLELGRIQEAQDVVDRAASRVPLTKSLEQLKEDCRIKLAGEVPFNP